MENDLPIKLVEPSINPDGSWDGFISVQAVFHRNKKIVFVIIFYKKKTNFAGRKNLFQKKSSLFTIKYEASLSKVEFSRPCTI